MRAGAGSHPEGGLSFLIGMHAEMDISVAVSDPFRTSQHPHFYGFGRIV